MKMSPSRFDFKGTGFAGLYSVMRKPIEDNRGFFARFYCADEFRNIGLTQSISQMNYTLTRQKGAVRGMHFQNPPFTEAKVVSCVRGEIFDVVVDIRRGSPTFLKWYAEVLNVDKQNSLFIPDGFAHGFQTLTDDCELIYLHTAPYNSSAEDALNVLDPEVAIDWPLGITEVSERDHNHPMIDKNFNGIEIS